MTDGVGYWRHFFHVQYNQAYTAITALTVLMAASSASADCSTRHFYNHENVEFLFIMANSGSCTIGNSPMQGDCLVPPGGVAEIHYENGALMKDLALSAVASAFKAHYNIPDRGLVVATAKPVGWFKSQSFDVNPSSCYIHHPSDTGILVINDPADGDITVDCRESCIAARERSKR
jgi:hypothetical protein